MKRYILCACLLAVMAACGHHDDADEHEHHHHEETSLQLTAYGRHFEIYAEATPFFTEGDEQCELLTHVTWLHDFHPLAQGTVTAILSVGGQKITAQTKNSEKPGIFHLSLKPKTTGKATLTYVIETSDIVDTLVINDLRVFDKEETARHEAEEGKIASPTAVRFTKEQSWQVDFATALPQVLPLGQTVQTVAQVQHAAGDEMTVVAKTSGILRFTSANLTEGESVRQGASLCRVVSEGFVDENLSVKLSEAKNNFETAKQNYERSKPLIDSKIISQEEFLNRKNAYENAKLTYENLKSVGNGGTSGVTAPMSGYVTQILVANGSFVTVGQPILVLSQNRDLVLKAELPQRYAAVLPSVASANIENPTTGVVSSLQELNGRVVSYGKSLSSDNFMFPLTLQIRNSSGFAAGAFAKIWLLGQPEGESLVIPKTALVEEQGNFYVFVQLTPELFEKQLVKIGASDGKSVAVLSGLTPDQRIVTRGAVLVKLAKASGALDPHAGHVH